MDWDDAYANAAHIQGGEAYPARWAAAAAAFRAELSAEGRANLDVAYGSKDRNRFDLFRPDGPLQGLFVFVHGGYWMSFDKSSWSHLAKGPLAHGFAVAMPSYTLCPQASIPAIVGEIASAIVAAAEHCTGPLVLAGHSAGGQLVTRMVASPSPLPDDILARITMVVSISGLHDLHPLMKTAMNATLGITEEQALAQSPALLAPAHICRIEVQVGADERPEFLRQSQMLVDAWRAAGARINLTMSADRHHFDVIDDLSRPASAILEKALART